MDVFLYFFFRCVTLFFILPDIEIVIFEADSHFVDLTTFGIDSCASAANGNVHAPTKGRDNPPEEQPFLVLRGDLNVNFETVSKLAEIQSDWHRVEIPTKLANWCLPHPAFP
jgi:hypothetical protein